MGPLKNHVCSCLGLPLPHPLAERRLEHSTINSTWWNVAPRGINSLLLLRYTCVLPDLVPKENALRLKSKRIHTHSKCLRWDYNHRQKDNSSTAAEIRVSQPDVTPGTKGTCICYRVPSNVCSISNSLYVTNSFHLA